MKFIDEERRVSQAAMAQSRGHNRMKGAGQVFPEVSKKSDAKQMRLLELFSGTGSVGRAFERHGWEVTSLDMDPASNASIIANFMEWDWSDFETGHFDCIWASPPCTHYSIARTTAKTPQDIEGSNRLVERVLALINDMFPVVWFVENPQTGYLKHQPVVQGLRYRDVSYCVFGFPDKKATRIWTNSSFWDPPAMCSRSSPCEYYREHGHHAMSAQRGPARQNGQLKPNDRCTLNQLHSMPPALCDEICMEATRAVMRLQSGGDA
jgi:hypothetical protein